jgi:chromosome segregation ATPase
MDEQFDSVNSAFDTADKNLDDIQKSIDKFDEELLRLNAELVNRRGSKKRAVQQQIKNIEQSLKRKQAQYTKASRVSKSATKIGTKSDLMDNVTKGLQAVSGVVGGLTGTSQIGKVLADEPILKSSAVVQDLDEVTVTAPKKEDFISKYKFYLIGAGALILLLMFKKK